MELASFQLTHDYLVPSLREWLGAKQRSTPQGRAELLLMDRAALWSLKGERRQLPSFREWFSIYRWTQKKSWSPLQKQMEESFLKPYRILLHILMIAPFLSTWATFLWNPSLVAFIPTALAHLFSPDTNAFRQPNFHVLLTLTIFAVGVAIRAFAKMSIEIWQRFVLIDKHKRSTIKIRRQHVTILGLCLYSFLRSLF